MAEAHCTSAICHRFSSERNTATDCGCCYEHRPLVRLPLKTIQKDGSNPGDHVYSAAASSGVQQLPLATLNASPLLTRR